MKVFVRQPAKDSPVPVVTEFCCLASQIRADGIASTKIAFIHTLSAAFKKQRSAASPQTLRVPVLLMQRGMTQNKPCLRTHQKNSQCDNYCPTQQFWKSTARRRVVQQTHP